MKRIVILADDAIAVEIARQAVGLPGVHDFQMSIDQSMPGIDLGPAPRRRVKLLGDQTQKPKSLNALVHLASQAGKQKRKPREAARIAVMDAIKHLRRPFKVKDVVVNGYSSKSVEAALRIYRDEGVVKPVGGDQNKGFLYDLA